MSFYLAIDAGGTKTDYVLADQTRELARARSGTIKRMRASVETATANLDGALAELTAASGVPMNAVARTCIGTAGSTVPLVTDWLRKAFAARVAGDLLLLSDVEIALDAAFPGQPGILVLAGTGSNVAGRSHSGQLTTVGGWGPTLADQGSGHRIGTQALRAIFLAIDEAGSVANAEAPTALLPAVLDFWKLGSVDQLIEHANSMPAPDFSRLAALVLACAEQRDPVARSVLKGEGVELAHLVLIAARRLQRLAPDPDWTPRIAFAGSILEKVPLVRESLLAALHAEFPSIHALSGVVDPVDGAVWRARTGLLTSKSPAKNPA